MAVIAPSAGDRFIDALIAWMIDLGRMPTPTEAKAGGAPAAYREGCRLFGGWAMACAEALERQAEEPVDLTRLEPTPRRRRPSRPRMLTALKDWAQEHDRSPLFSDFLTAEAPLPGEPIRREFGSWDAALEAAELERVRVPGWSEGRAIYMLREAADWTGQAPSYNAVMDEDAAGIVVALFGSWPAGLVAAGLVSADDLAADGSLR